MRKYGSLVNRIEKALKELGPLTGAELCQELNVEKSELSAVVSRMARPGKELPKRVYVVRYVYEHELHRKRYPRAVYDLGDKPDAIKPKSSTKKNRQRYDQNLRKRMTGNSVFNLALPRRVYEQRRSTPTT